LCKMFCPDIIPIFIELADKHRGYAAIKGILAIARIKVTCSGEISDSQYIVVVVERNCFGISRSAELSCPDKMAVCIQLANIASSDRCSQEKCGRSRVIVCNTQEIPRNVYISFICNLYVACRLLSDSGKLLHPGQVPITICLFDEYII